MRAVRVLGIGVGVAFSGVALLSLRADAADDTPAKVSISPGAVDELVFREGLRRRGLVDWLAQHDADHRPDDPVEARFRRRDALLAELETGEVPPHIRRKRIAEARAILTELIASERQHPGRLDWMLASAVDALERVAPEAFDAVLLHELAGRHRREVAELSEEAVAMLTALREDLAAAWSAVEALDEPLLAEWSDAGVLGRLETLDARSAVMLAWARLCRALTADVPDAERAAELLDVLDEVTQRRGWTDAGESDPELVCEASAIAAVAARRAGRHEEAIEHARRLVTTFGQVRDAAQRARLRPLSLLAVLEQIRATRDAGRYDEALRAVDTARQWVRDVRPGDLSTHLAVELAECAILAGPAWRESLFASPKALAPLTMWMLAAPDQRDVAYAVLAGAVADTPITRESTLLQVQWALGGAIHDARTRCAPDDRPTDARLQDVLAVAQRRVKESTEIDAALIAGEVAYLVGCGLQMVGRSLDAVAEWCDLADRWPMHERTNEALNRAVATAQACLEPAGCGDLDRARALFVRAGRLIRALWPADSAAQRLAYPIALVLEQAGQWQEAADAYRQVEENDPHAVAAWLGRARCLHHLFERELARAAADAPTLARLAEEAVQAVEDGLARMKERSAATAPDKDATCAEAQMALLAACLYNHPQIARPARVVEVLADFEQRFGACTDRTGAMLRERIVALKRLGRLDEARAEVAKLAAQDEQRSGAVMVQLLEAMRAEIDAAADRGERTRVREVAAEAADLAEMLLTWMKRHPPPSADRDRLTVRIWRARALLQAGRASDGLTAYEACARDGVALLADHPVFAVEILLGRAESLAALERWDEALSIFAEVRGRTAEESPHWWRAFVGQLECHHHLGVEPVPIVQAIRQRRHLSPSLGAPRWKRRLDALEAALEGRRGELDGAGPSRQP